MASFRTAGAPMDSLHRPVAVLVVEVVVEGGLEQSQSLSTSKPLRFGEVKFDLSWRLFSILTNLIENIYLTGSVDALQNWSPDNAMLLSSSNYPIWSSKHIVDSFAAFLTNFLCTFSHR